MGQKLLYIGFVGIFIVSSNSLVHFLPETYKFKQDLTARKVFAKLFSKSGKLLYIWICWSTYHIIKFCCLVSPQSIKTYFTPDRRKSFCQAFFKKLVLFFKKVRAFFKKRIKSISGVIEAPAVFGFVKSQRFKIVLSDAVQLIRGTDLGGTHGHFFHFCF